MKNKNLEIDSSQFFYASNGEIIKNLEELSSFLKKIDEETFSKHVDENKNDFSNWIKEVFNEKKLSQKIEKCKNPLEMSKIISKRLLKDQKETDKKISDKINNAPLISKDKIRRKILIGKIKRHFK